MFCNLKWLFLPSLAILLTLGCGKELSYESPTNTGGTDTTGITTGGTAQYSLGSCADASVSGTFVVGKALSADAQITMKVNVTKTGNWSIVTGSVNGMKFIGGGVFTEIGTQMVTLTGIGTPTIAGTKSIAYNVGGTTCSVSITTTTEDNSIGNADYYYTITIDGKTYTQTVTMDNNYEAGSGASGGDDVTLGASIEYGYDNPPATATSFGITIGTMHGYESATNDDFKAYFAPGSRNYTKDFNTMDGVTIGWKDANGVNWETDFGSGDQTGSTFSIVSVAGAPDITGTYYLKTKMQFKCKLYNETTGEVKTVTSGEMLGSFGKI
jgi:hypothetical protein